MPQGSSRHRKCLMGTAQSASRAEGAAITVAVEPGPGVGKVVPIEKHAGGRRTMWAPGADAETATAEQEREVV